MKKMYVLLVALSILPLTIDVNAQPYKPCLVEGAEWRSWFFVPRPCKSMMKSYEYTYGELIIKPQRVDDKYWGLSFVEAGDYYKPKNNNDDWHIEHIYHWEDITTGKLYAYFDYRDDSKDCEFLIMDMSLEVGDKWNDATVVKVYYVDGRKYIELDKYIKLDETLHEFSVPYTFIEGIGPNVGFFGPDDVLLSCKYEDGENVYAINHPTFDGCSMLQNRIDDTSVNDLSNGVCLIYPNPVKDVMTIGNVAFGNLQIHDLTGKVIKTVDSCQPTIDVSDLKSGVYFVNIQIGADVLINKIVKL